MSWARGPFCSDTKRMSEISRRAVRDAKSIDRLWSFLWVDFPAQFIPTVNRLPATGLIASRSTTPSWGGVKYGISWGKLPKLALKIWGSVKRGTFRSTGGSFLSRSMISTFSPTALTATRRFSSGWISSTIRPPLACSKGRYLIN